MTTNVFFDFFNCIEEQSLLEDLVIESIQIYGQDMYYLPRRNENVDKIYGTSDIVKFDRAYELEFYIKSIDGFSGDGNFMSQFGGLEIRDQIIFTVAKRTFEDNITELEPDINRPREGDLIYFPLNKKCFQIMFADNKPTFYQLGALQTYNLTCEVYEYSSEIFETGIEEIDILSNNTQDIYTSAILDDLGNFLMTETGDYILYNSFGDEDSIDELSDTFAIQKESDDFIDFSEIDPFTTGGKY